MDWGCQLLTDVGPTLAKILDRLQYAALRIALGVMCTTPTNVILHLSGEGTLNARRRMLTSKYVAKCVACQNHPVAQRWRALLAEGTEIAPYLEFFMPRMFVELIPRYSTEVTSYDFAGSLDWDYDIRFLTPTVDLASGGELVHLKGSVGSPDDPVLETVRECIRGAGFGGARGKRSEADEIFFQLTRNYADTPAIYTDGSKVSDGGAGLGIFSPDLGMHVSFTAHGSLSVFAIESIAILNAVNIVEESGCTRALIVSDFRSALHAIASPDSRDGKHRIIYAILRRLQKLAKDGLTIELMWVPSHINLYDNNIADGLSRQAAEAASTVENNLRDISTCFINDILNDLTKEYETFALNEVNEEAQSKGFRYFNKVKEKSRGDWFRNHPRLPRHLITLVNRIRSFHTRCNAHLNDKGIVESPACECGAQLQDIEHVFLNCPLNEEESARLITKIYSGGLPDNVCDIAFGDSPRGYWALADFVARTKKTL